MNRIRLLGALCFCMLMLCRAGNIYASLVLDFSGITETDFGYNVGVFRAEVGTPFVVLVTIDETNAASGIYPIIDVHGNLGGIPFSTSGPWDIEPLQAIQESDGIYLSNFGSINSAGEAFFVDLRVIGADVLSTDPTSWFGTGPLGAGSAFGPSDSTSDIYVGSGINNINISTYQPYAGTLLLEGAAVPIPATIWLFGSGLLGLIGITRYKKVT